MIMQMARLAKTPTGIPSDATLLPYLKSLRFESDHSLVAFTRPDIIGEVWRLVEVLRAAPLGFRPEAAYSLHKLNGKMKDYLECHLEGDLLLVFRYLKVPDEKGTVREHLLLHRLGTHNKVFGR